MDDINTFRSFTEETLEDALVPIRERFGEDACELARQHLRNPLRKLCSDAGTVGYRKGKPVCFQVACLRRLYWKQKEFFGIVGGLTCRMRKGCPPSVTFETIERAAAPRLGSVMRFGNSCCAEAAKINETSGDCVGPETCARFRWRAIRPLECLSYFVRRKIFKGSVPSWPLFSTLDNADFTVSLDTIRVERLKSVTTDFFDRFMVAYLESNKGLVCSRTAEEIDWIFGERVKKGEAVILGAYADGDPVGYVILQGGCRAKRWMLVDWIALRNDRKVLSTLLQASIRFLKKRTPAMMLESIGFPSFADRILKKFLPHVRPIGFNQFFWDASDAETKRNIVAEGDSSDSWFFGPYDGDFCFE